MTERPVTLSHKNAAVSFLRLAASGRAREAFATYMAPGFRHHNPFFTADADALMTAMEDNARQHPRKSFDLHHALEDGDLVALHAHVHFEPGDRGVALVHVFRFEGDRIAELWDVGQPVPDTSPNVHEMF